LIDINAAATGGFDWSRSNYELIAPAAVKAARLAIWA
jgi:hypothetical protein